MADRSHRCYLCGIRGGHVTLRGHIARTHGVTAVTVAAAADTLAVSRQMVDYLATEGRLRKVASGLIDADTLAAEVAYRQAGGAGRGRTTTLPSGHMPTPVAAPPPALEPPEPRPAAVSGRQAKAYRREQRLREVIAQAHDRLHRDDVDAAHEVLHQGLGSGRYEGPVAPLAAVGEFDAEFRRLCVAHGVRASYVAIDPKHSTVGAARLLSGGDAELDQLVVRSVRAVGGVR